MRWPPPWLSCPQCGGRAEYKPSKRGRLAGYYCECGLRVHIKKQSEGKLPCAPALYDLTFPDGVTSMEREAFLKEWKEARYKARQATSKYIFVLRDGVEVRALRARAFVRAPKVPVFQVFQPFRGGL